jgi:ubiquinone/menaquinone biosynthesis C-methylase UbiE
VGVSSEEISAATSPGWSWDPSLYAGSARFYTVGRVAYPVEVIEVLVEALALDGLGRLLDVGCGPGSLTLLLAPYFAEAIGVDADADMLAEAARQARRRNVRNVRWRQLRAEELPADLPAVRVATFAQSLHWMDRGHVLVRVRAMLEPNGSAVHVHATTHQGIDTDVQLPYPQPPREQITQLVHRYLGSQRRAGQGVLTPGTSETEEVIYRAAGFTGPERFEVPARTVQRTVEEIVASVYSLSSASPHLFGDRLEQFDTELRGLLVETAENGCFSEQMRSITLDIWH